jgi:hypothetical protein
VGTCLSHYRNVFISVNVFINVMSCKGECRFTSPPPHPPTHPHTHGYTPVTQRTVWLVVLSIHDRMYAGWHATPLLCPFDPSPPWITPTSPHAVTLLLLALLLVLLEDALTVNLRSQAPPLSPACMPEPPALLT